MRKNWDNLYSQIAEIDAYLQRTQKKYDATTRKCRNGTAFLTPKNDQTHGGNIHSNIEHGHCSLSTSADSEQGEVYVQKPKAAGEGKVAAISDLTSQDHSRFKELEEDEKVENLLRIAQKLSRQIHNQKGSSPWM